MTKLKEIGLQISEKEYRDLPHLSSSFFSGLSRLGAAVVNDNFSGNDGTSFGTIVDDIICGTHNKDNYYTIPSEELVGDTLKQAIDMIFDLIDHTQIADNDQYYNAVVEVLTHNTTIPYYPKNKPEDRAAKILDKGSKYFKMKVDSRGKQLIDFNWYNNARKAANTIKTHEFTKEIFELTDSQEGVFQFQFVFNYLGEDMKGMLDWIKVDHKTKTIEPYDIKTGQETVFQFQKSFYKWRYDIQSLLYTIICKFLVKRWYNGYTVKPFTFIYVCNTQPDKVLKYKVSLNTLKGAKEGFTRNGYKYKGVAQLLNDLNWYKQNNFEVDFDEEMYKNNGVLTIDDVEL